MQGVIDPGPLINISVETNFNEKSGGWGGVGGGGCGGLIVVTLSFSFHVPISMLICAVYATSLTVTIYI